MKILPVINISYSSKERPDFDPRALLALGPQISVDLLPPLVVEKWFMNKQNKPRKITKISALIDTGASITGIDIELFRKLNYPPIDVATLTTPSGHSHTNIYMVRLAIPSEQDPNFPPNIPRIIIDNIKAVGVQLANQQYKILLGRDVLSKMILVYNGSQALVTLGY